MKRSPWVMSTILLVTALGGCALPRLPSEPWVRPYERESLSDPSMRRPGDGLSERHLERVRQSRESARGATSASGGVAGGG